MLSLPCNCKLQKADIGTVPYLEIGDIDIDTKCYTLKNKPSVAGANFVVKDDILISLVRPTRGAIVKIDDECISASNAFCVLRGRNNLITEYLFNYLMYNLDFFKSFTSFYNFFHISSPQVFFFLSDKPTVSSKPGKAASSIPTHNPYCRT